MASKTFAVAGVGNIVIYKRKTNRSMRLTVEADGGIRVTIPLWVPYRAGLAFANSRKEWIRQHVPKISNAALLLDGQPIGKQHKLVFLSAPSSTRIRTSVSASAITISYNRSLGTDSPTNQEAARLACIRALRKEAEMLILPRLRQLSITHGLPYRIGTIKQLKTRWGSCDQHRNIVINLYLVQLPWELIDYVLLHELAHTVVLHHGPLFWAKLESLIPNARNLRKSMKTYRPALIVQAKPNVP